MGLRWKTAGQWGAVRQVAEREVGAGQGPRGEELPVGERRTTASSKAGVQSLNQRSCGEALEGLRGPLWKLEVTMSSSREGVRSGSGVQGSEKWGGILRSEGPDEGISSLVHRAGSRDGGGSPRKRPAQAGVKPGQAQSRAEGWGEMRAPAY